MRLVRVFDSDVVARAVAGFAAAVVASLAAAGVSAAQESQAAPAAGTPVSDPAALFERDCAACHMGGYPKAPHVVTFQIIGRDAIYDSMTTGLMRPNAQHLSEEERRALADFLGGATEDSAPPLMCEGRQVEPAANAPRFEGWGLTLASTRFVSAEDAGVNASNVGNLELKWAFAYPGATRARSQPSYHRGVVIVGSQSGAVYALELKTGCAHWVFEADAEVRNAVSIAADFDRPLALFGDIAGSVYAIDLEDGGLIWRTRADDHPALTITGSPRLHGDRLYVPLSSTEWAGAADPSYPCCTFRGGVTALDARTGELIWRTYSITDEPAPTGEVNEDTGAIRYHPAGAPIWNSPTIDEKRGVLYVGTGEGYTSPAVDTTDAVLAMDLDTGEIVWSYQSIAGDAWNMACFVGGGPNCPEEDGPDMDIGAPPVLVTLPDGRDVVIVGQKSAHIFALDPDNDGALLWRKKVGRGGFSGGVHWGMAANEATVFAPNTDTVFTDRFSTEPKPGLFALDPATGETLWFAPAPDVCAEEDRPACDPGLSAAATATPDLVFAGGFDGHLRAYDASSGEILWDFDTNAPFETVSGDIAHGGSIDSDGPVIVDGHVLVNSGYLFGGRMPGNVLLVFDVPEDGRSVGVD